MTARKAPLWLQRLAVFAVCAAFCGAVWGLLFLCLWLGVDHTNAAIVVGKWLAVIVAAVLAGVFGERFRQWHIRREQAAVWRPHHAKPGAFQEYSATETRARILAADRFDVYGTDE